VSLERDFTGLDGIDTRGGNWDHAADSVDLLNNSPSSPSRDYVAKPWSLKNALWIALAVPAMAVGLAAPWVLLPGVFRWVLDNPGPDLLVWAVALFGWLLAGALLAVIVQLPAIIVGSLLYVLVGGIGRDPAQRADPKRDVGWTPKVPSHAFRWTAQAPTSCVGWTPQLRPDPQVVHAGFSRKRGIDDD
jgi:hypothetical protein